MHELVKWSKTRHLPRLARTEECSRINNYASFVGSNPTLELNCKNAKIKMVGEIKGFEVGYFRIGAKLSNTLWEEFICLRRS
ncbi:hypothetical protein PZ06_07775 [Lacticaseibacillus rhamnosus]|nr:hypothetical protein PZ06_07775 [Lacticaseibacillus rhamnosus]